MEDKLRDLLRLAADSASGADPSVATEIARRVRRRRAATVGLSVLAAVVLISGVATTAATLLGNSNRNTGFLNPEPASSNGSVTEVSTSAEGGSLQCIARVPSGAAKPGDPIEVRYLVRNVSKGPVTVTGGRDHPNVHDESGRIVWRAFDAIPIPPSGPASFPRPLAPSATEQVWGWSVRAMGSGLLSIDVKCPLAEKHGAGTLPPIRVRVEVPGPTPSRDEAVAAAVRGSAGLFGHCTPPADGGWIDGRVVAPDGAKHVPDMRASCRARLSVHEGFIAVTLEGASPDRRYSTPNIGGEDRNNAWWELGFVVTNQGPRFLYLTGVLNSTTTQPQRMIPHYSFDGTRWTRGTFAACGTGGGPAFGFVSVCGR